MRERERERERTIQLSHRHCYKLSELLVHYLISRSLLVLVAVLVSISPTN